MTTTPRTKTKPKPKAAKPKPKRTATTYPDNIRAAVARGRYTYAAKRPGLDGERPAAASAGAHVHVRKVVGGMVGTVTPDAIVKASGAKSFAALKSIAEWTGDPAPLRPLGRQVDGGGWERGRYLAAILVVWVEELRAAK